MRAVWYEEIGKARDVLKIGDADIPTPKNGEIRVRIHSSGVNPSDAKMRSGARGDMAFPKIIPHSDGAGVVDEIGQGNDGAGLEIGQRVWVYNAAFQRANGTCADYVCLPQSLVVPLPDGTSFDEGASLGIPAQTAMQAVLLGGDLTNKNVLVTGGAGAVERYAVQFAKLKGAKRVFTTISSDEKAAHVANIGADDIINYKQDNVVDYIMSASNGHGIDHIIDVEFGGNIAISNDILAPCASIATYGSEACKNPEIPFYPLMFKNISLHWIFIYAISPDQRRHVIDNITHMLKTGQLNHAIGKKFDYKDVASAHELIEGARRMGSVIVNFQ